MTYDRETRKRYTVIVFYSDGSGSVYTTVNITVRNVNEPPTISGPTSVEFAEDRIDQVGMYTATDPEDGVITWSLAGTDAGAFEISDSGVLTFSQKPDSLPGQHEYPTDSGRKNEYKVTVQASDGNSYGTLDVVVTVTDVNEPPTVSGPTGINYPEEPTRPVAVYQADDPEKDDTTWSLAGTDHGDFEISDSGVLTFSQKPDYEYPTDSGRKNEYKVTVQASDGRRTGTLAVTVTVTDVDEPPVISGLGSVRYEENATTAVGDYSASDPEDETVTLSLVGMDEEALELSATGVLTFGEVPDRENPADLNRDNVYEVTVRAEDGTNTADFGVTITVTNVNEAPTVHGDASPDYEEGDTGPVGMYFALDPENNPVTLSLVGTDKEDLKLSGGGVLTFRQTPDYEDPDDSGRKNTYEVTVRAEDGTNTADFGVVVTVTNVDEDGTVSLSSVQPQVGTELGAVLSDPDGRLRPLPGCGNGP